MNKPASLQYTKQVSFQIMDEYRFHSGEPIDEKLQYVNLRALTPILSAIIPGDIRFKLTGRSRKDIYQLLASQEPSIQDEAYINIQQLLANPTKNACKSTWIVKRRQEDEQAELRNVRARLETINNSLNMHGTSKNEKIIEQTGPNTA